MGNDAGVEAVERPSKSSLTGRWLPLLFVLPAIALVSLVTFIPIGYGIYTSFLHKTIYTVNPMFVGFENYGYILADPELYSSVFRSIYFSCVSTAVQVGAGLLIALTIKKMTYGKSLVRSLVLLPYLLPIISVGLIMRWCFHDVYGVFNYLLRSAGMIDEYISFFGDMTIAMPSVIIAESWKFAMFSVMILLARLETIDPAFYEAAEVCGASIWQKFRDITLPALRSSILFIVLVRTIWMFNKFDIIHILTQGGPLKSTTTVPVYIYVTAFGFDNLGEACAIGAVSFIILVIGVLLYFKLLKPERAVVTSQ